MYTYKMGDSLYINLTNRCTNNCIFCIRSKSGLMDLDLWLDKEPSWEEVIDEITDPSIYEEIVFCGYGEPTAALPQMLQICRKLKPSNIKLRLNTNGHGSMLWQRNIVPELAEFFDSVSISLNAKDADSYNLLCQPDDKANSYAAVIDFTKECVKYIPKVCLTVVDVLSAYDIQQCREIAERLGADFRVRHNI